MPGCNDSVCMRNCLSFLRQEQQLSPSCVPPGWKAEGGCNKKTEGKKSENLGCARSAGSTAENGFSVYLVCMKTATAALMLCVAIVGGAQAPDSLRRFRLLSDVSITVDSPKNLNSKYETLVILYALPNGNTTEQTMGKKMAAGDDWHFDIQHVGAQTAFLRNELPEKNIVVACLENSDKSWPQWKTKHPAYVSEVQFVVDTIFGLFNGKKSLYLNGHSGGGRFIFSYLDGVKGIPSYVKNISFLDSDYGYDSTYLPKLLRWLQQNKDAHLNVFAYNDSVALLNGKRFVSDTGGTWYRSRLLLRHLQTAMTFDKTRDDSLIVHQSRNGQVRFCLKTNPEQKIFHTRQVELNGFIHSVLIGTKREEKRYRYFGERAYTDFIK